MADTVVVFFLVNPSFAGFSLHPDGIFSCDSANNPLKSRLDLSIGRQIVDVLPCMLLNIQFWL